LKNKSFSAINILGLAIGIAACVIIYLYVNNELSYDQYNKKADRIARITTILHTPESDMLLATTPTPLAKVLTKDFPQVQQTVRLEPAPKIIKLNNEPIREDAFYKADQAIFTVFDFDFIQGSPLDALKNPNSTIITEKIAKK